MIELRQYQQDAVRVMALYNEGVCVAPAGSGKTIIAAALVLDRIELLDCMTPGKRNKVSWIAHTKEQVEQACDALQALGVPDKADCMVSCYAGHNDLLTQCDVLIVDECHWAGCDQVKRLIENAGIANECSPYIYGFTATPKREDGFDITEVIGPIRYEVSRSDIQSVGGVLPAEVRVVEIAYAGIDVDALALPFYTRGMKWKDTTEGTDECWKRCQYRAATQYAVRENDYRNKTIKFICMYHQYDSILILVDTKDHGAKLESMIEGAVFVSSASAKRSKKLDAFKYGETRVLIATQLADEGMDTPIAGVLILAAPGKAAGKVIQRTGRVLRPHPGKDKGIIYEFRDMSHGMLTAQHWGRVRTYKKMGYRIVRAAI